MKFKKHIKEDMKTHTNTFKRDKKWINKFYDKLAVKWSTYDRKHQVAPAEGGCSA